MKSKTSSFASIFYDGEERQRELAMAQFPRPPSPPRAPPPLPMWLIKWVPNFSLVTYIIFPLRPAPPPGMGRGRKKKKSFSLSQRRLSYLKTPEIGLNLPF